MVVVIAFISTEKRLLIVQQTICLKLGRLRGIIFCKLYFRATKVLT